MSHETVAFLCGAVFGFGIGMTVATVWIYTASKGKQHSHDDDAGAFTPTMRDDPNLPVGLRRSAATDSRVKDDKPCGVDSLPARSSPTGATDHIDPTAASGDSEGGARG